MVFAVATQGGGGPGLPASCVDVKIRLPPQLLHILHFDYSPWLLLLLLLHLRPKSLTSLMVLALSSLLSRSRGMSRGRRSSCSSSSRRRKQEKEQQLGRNSLDIVAVSQKQLFAVCLTDTYPTVLSPYLLFSLPPCSHSSYSALGSSVALPPSCLPFVAFCML